MSRNDYEWAFHRLTAAHQIVNRLWQNSPDIQPDMVKVYEAVQAWPWISNGYQLAEQGVKLLLAVRQDIPLRDIRSTLGLQAREAHYLDTLVRRLDDQDQEALSLAYSGFVDVHRHIPVSDLRDFLDLMGRGYTKWRYMLLDGGNGVPPNHIGAMLEIIKAINHRLYQQIMDSSTPFRPVRNRLVMELESAIVYATNRISGSREDLEGHLLYLKQLLSHPSWRETLADNLEITHNPRHGPQPPPNPFYRQAPKIHPDLAKVLEQLEISQDRKNMIVFLREDLLWQPR